MTLDGSMDSQEFAVNLYFFLGLLTSFAILLNFSSSIYSIIFSMRYYLLLHAYLVNTKQFKNWFTSCCYCNL